MILMHRSLWRFIQLLGMSCLLVACGLHLRGTESAPEAFRHLYVAYVGHTTSDFESELNDMLTAIHITLVERKAFAGYELKIVSVHFTIDQPTLMTTSQPLSYTYKYVLRYQLLSKDLQPVTPVRRIAEKSVLVTLPTQILSVSREGERRTELRRAVINRLHTELLSTYMQNAIQSFETQQQARKP